MLTMDIKSRRTGEPAHPASSALTLVHKQLDAIIGVISGSNLVSVSLSDTRLNLGTPDDDVDQVGPGQGGRGAGGRGVGGRRVLNECRTISPSLDLIVHANESQSKQPSIPHPASRIPHPFSLEVPYLHPSPLQTLQYKPHCSHFTSQKTSTNTFGGLVLSLTSLHGPK